MQDQYRSIDIIATGQGAAPRPCTATRTDRSRSPSASASSRPRRAEAASCACAGVGHERRPRRAAASRRVARLPRVRSRRAFRRNSVRRIAGGSRSHDHDPPAHRPPGDRDAVIDLIHALNCTRRTSPATGKRDRAGGGRLLRRAACSASPGADGRIVLAEAEGVVVAAMGFSHRRGCGLRDADDVRRHGTVTDLIVAEEWRGRGRRPTAARGGRAPDPGGRLQAASPSASSPPTTARSASTEPSASSPTCRSW